MRKEFTLRIEFSHEDRELLYKEIFTGKMSRNRLARVSWCMSMNLAKLLAFIRKITIKSY